MKFLSITGPKDDIDRVVESYLSKYEIHLENTLAELKTVHNLEPYIQVNPYKETLKQAEDYAALLPEGTTSQGKQVSVEEALSIVGEIDHTLSANRLKRTELESERNKILDLMDKIAPFQNLPCDISELFQFQFIRSRFGKIPQVYYARFKNYIYDNAAIVFYPCESDANYVWGLYLTTRENLSKVDAIFSSMHFERILLPNAYEGTPSEAYQSLLKHAAKVEEDIKGCDKEMDSYLKEHSAELMASKERLDALSENFDVRKLAARTKDENENYYILCGWMAADDADAFQKEIAEDENVFCVMEDNSDNISTTPPTKLKNPRFFKPFEMFVKMFGLPGYREFDPTIYLAITYSILFGIMFGDVGQGLCFVVGGFLLYAKKKSPLPAIMGTAGIFSTIFGLVYNSFFGFEAFFPYEPLLRAKDDMMTLPVLGSMNVVFVLAIAFGMFMILLNMVMGIINAVRQHDVENTWFSQNAVGGIIFYGSVVAMIFLLMSGHGNLKTLLKILLILAIVGILIIFLKELLARIVEKKKPYIEGGAGMYFVQAFFETFETVLSFLSNTLSYVRVGAYAVSHVAMMQVVMMLAGAENGGSPSIVILIIGNIFVAALEALMVAIQVLRLEYYEMFSRFYKGNGRAFKPFIKKD